MKNRRSIYLAFIKQQFQSLMEYRLDFLLGVFGLAILQINVFLLIFAAFTHIKELGGYNFFEVLLMFGYGQIIRGIDHVYNDNIWFIAWYSIREGNFYKYLIRPINPITHIIMERIAIDGFGEVIMGLIIFLYAFVSLKISFTWLDCLVMLLFMLCGIVIYFAIKLLFASIALWTTSSGEIMTLAYETNGFARYPLEIYKNRVIEFFITFVMPFAIVTYFPMIYFIRDTAYIGNYFQIVGFEKYYIILFEIAVSVVFLILSLLVWNRGLKRFQATGS